ncbi:sialidase-4-like [Alosa sapidissima]|uniref:sialidase-4-like n=1 Tax=Alosa sapidissima TaxID=34773 RepID=UPI001C0909A5|nr:sialidase-4-like [Alosa sapidissima]
MELLQPHDAEDIVFKHEKDHFRIPALLYIEKWKKYLAFAERRTSTADHHARRLVMSTGTRDTDGKVKWSSITNLEKATKAGYRSMSPCPVFETNTGTLFLFFICIEGSISENSLKPEQTCLCYVTTQDEHLGDESWSKLKDVTDDIVFADNKKLSEYQTFAVGPGHGIEVGVGTSNDTRLLIPAYVKMSKDECHALVFYSDDGGEHWQAGNQLFDKSGECQVAQVRGVEDTELFLYCNACTLGGENEEVPRLEALSDDTGASFTKLQSLSLKETPHGCQGSVLGFPATGLDSPNTWLLFSHPTKGLGWTRRDLGIYLRMSLQDGGNRDCRPWGEPFIIHPGKSGYSDLAQCEKKDRFACLMECGEADPLQIVFKEFALSEILSSPDSQCCVCGSSCCCCKCCIM